MNANESLKSKINLIIATVLSYWIVSISMVFINKYLLSSADLKFDAPLFVTWYQSVICVLIYLTSLLIKKYTSFEITIVANLNTNLKIANSIFPLAITFISMILFNNLSLKHISVSFYMIVRSLSTIFNVILVYLYFGEKTSIRALGCCAVITFGFFLGVQQENAFSSSLIGVIYGVLSSFFAPLYSVYIKKTIKLVDNNLWTLNYWVNIYASVLFIPLIFYFGEDSKIVNFEHLYEPYFWFVLTLSGLLSFGVGYLTSLQINVTSPLTHNISGTTKSYIQTLLGVLVYDEVKSYLWWASNFMVLVGAALYSYVRNNEMVEKFKRTNSNTNIDNIEKQSLNNEVSNVGIEVNKNEPNNLK